MGFRYGEGGFPFPIVDLGKMIAVSPFRNESGVAYRSSPHASEMLNKAGDRTAPLLLSSGPRFHSSRSPRPRGEVLTVSPADRINQKISASSSKFNSSGCETANPRSLSCRSISLRRICVVFISGVFCICQHRSPRCYCSRVWMRHAATILQSAMICRGESSPRAANCLRTL